MLPSIYNLRNPLIVTFLNIFLLIYCSHFNFILHTNLIFWICSPRVLFRIIICNWILCLDHSLGGLPLKITHQFFLWCFFFTILQFISIIHFIFNVVWIRLINLKFIISFIFYWIISLWPMTFHVSIFSVNFLLLYFQF